MKKWLQTYISAQHRALDSVPLDGVARLIETLRSLWRRDGQIFVIGNGGSAANASHFATDLGKGASDKIARRFRILSLTDNAAWLTALGVSPSSAAASLKLRSQLITGGPSSRLMSSAVTAA